MGDKRTGKKKKKVRTVVTEETAPPAQVTVPAPKKTKSSYKS